MIINADNRFILWLLKERWRIVAAGILAIVSPLAGLSLYIYSQVTSGFERVVLAENEAILTFAAHHLEEKINTDISNAKTFADRPLLIEALEKNDAKAIDGHIRNFISNSLSIERIIVTNPAGIEIAAYPEDPSRNGSNLSGENWYKGVSVTWTPYVSDFFLRTGNPGRYLFAIAMPVKDPSGAVVGILVLHPKENYFSEVLEVMHIGKGFIYIVNKNGHLVYHPGFNLDNVYDFSSVPSVDKVKNRLSGWEKINDPVTKEAVVSAFLPMKFGWGVILQRPEKDVLQPVNKIVIGLFVFAGLSLLIGIIIAYDGMEMFYSIRSLSVKLEHTLGDLQRSNKELEQFAYIASHDLQEPLRKVASFTQLLERRYKGEMGPDADRYIGYIVDGAKRMSMLISDLLCFSRIGTSTRKFAPADCNGVVRRVIEDLQKVIEEKGAVVTFDSLPSIIADETQLGMVFQNLIGNAIKFHGQEPPRVHASARREGNEWVFSVRDNGIGIEQDYFDRIFVMFQRLHSKAQFPGTGIGLAICKKVVERHGGRIWVESEFGRGSTFYFRIPDHNIEVNES